MNKDEIFIDLTDTTINEWYNLASLGHKIKYIMWAMFGSNSPLENSSVRVRGTQSQLKAFAAALAAEGRFVGAIKKHGLNDPNIARSKTSLNRAISSFEKDTGIVWPFK